MVRFVASSDWQIGMAVHRFDADARARYVQARLDAVERIGEVAAAHDAAFVLVAGDVFESNHLDERTLLRALRSLGRIGVPVHLLPGNHDPLDGGSVYDSDLFERHRPGHVHVLRTTGPHAVADGVEVVAAPWTTKRPTRDLVADALADLAPAADGTVRVLLGHGQVEGLDPDRDRPTTVALDPVRAALADGRVRVAVLGDRHSVLEVEPGVWHPGTPEVTAHREVDPGHVLVVDVDADRLDVEPVRVGRWRFVSLHHTLHDADDVARLVADLDGLGSPERTEVRLHLDGALGLRDLTALDAALEERRPELAGLERWRDTLVARPVAADLDDLDLGGFAGDAVADLRSQAAGEGDATARDALALLHRLAGAAR